MRHLLLALLLLALAPACGGGGGAGGAPGDVTGSWLLFLTDGGIDGDAMHLTLTQTDDGVRALFTCNGSLPTGAGTYAGGSLALSFDLGGGNTLTLSGAWTGAGLEGTYTGPDGVGTWRMEATTLAPDCGQACAPVAVERFVAHDITDLGKIREISLFRSSAGHDYSDGCEPCRSMKHYYSPPVALRANGVVPVFAPVDGLVVAVTNEGHGAAPGLTNKQVRLRSTAHPDVTFILFHLDLASAAIAVGASLTAGDLLGTAHLWYPDMLEVAHDFDVAVRLHTLVGDRYLSFVDLMSDVLFSTYAARGVPSRASLILSQAARDADPLTCSGQTFTSSGALPAWFVLGP